MTSYVAKNQFKLAFLVILIQHIMNLQNID
jgi:hypothetical protein